MTTRRFSGTGGMSGRLPVRMRLVGRRYFQMGSLSPRSMSGQPVGLALRVGSRLVRNSPQIEKPVHEAGRRVAALARLKWNSNTATVTATVRPTTGQSKFSRRIFGGGWVIRGVRGTVFPGDRRWDNLAFALASQLEGSRPWIIAQPPGCGRYAWPRIGRDRCETIDHQSYCRSHGSWQRPSRR